MAELVRDLSKARDAYVHRDSDSSLAAHKMKFSKIGITDSQHERNEDGHSDAGDYLKSMVFGGLDGTVTTFTLVCAAIGGHYTMQTLVVLGLAKVLGDAVSMGLGDAISEMAENSFVRAEKDREQWEMENYLEGELEEMVELYVKKGFKEGDARLILQTMVQKNPEFFLNHMLVQELGLMPVDEEDDPWKKGLVMFASFGACGSLVLAPFLLFEHELASNRSTAYVMSATITACVLGGLGWMKAGYTNQTKWKSAMNYMFVGALSASVAYIVSLLARHAANE